jgi:hypothetical protein
MRRPAIGLRWLAVIHRGGGIVSRRVRGRDRAWGLPMDGQPQHVRQFGRGQIPAGRRRRAPEAIWLARMTSSSRSSWPVSPGRNAPDVARCTVFEKLIGGQPTDLIAALQERGDQVTAALVGTGGKMGRDHGGQLLLVRIRYLKPQAASQECGRELALAVTGDHHDRERVAAHDPLPDHRLTAPVRGVHVDVRYPPTYPHQLRYDEFAVLEDIQQVVG